ncbi:HAD family hydrolase [Sphingomonas floccifaciens]|uniref:HAD family hydrolase n=1 Tax=Sphingomonas floccifaciens TaxID=1844115 RepID=A0ABW4NDB1_9SPHN
MATKTTIRAYDLATLLDSAPPGITTLSLDCFDTLLWRNTHAPKDVFCDIAMRGGAMQPRAWAETMAQRIAHRTSGSYEIRLADVYRRLLTNASEAEIAEAVEREICLEERQLFPFAPAVALMREAKARGLKIIIVSDMYIGEAELRRLLAKCAGDDVLAMVDHIFMSCEHGKPKAAGLFEPVLKAIGMRPDQVLHVGDNKIADYDGAARAGIHAVHLEQFDEEAKTRLRLEMSAGIMIDPATRVTVPAYQPHRAAVAVRQETDAAYVVGHDVMGPVMHAFAELIKRDADALSARIGKRVRPLFMLRDGYLPWRVFDALYPDYGAAQVELSRLVATRSTLTDAAALDLFTAENVHVLTPQSFARHLMLFDGECRTALKSSDPRAAMGKLVRDPDIRRKVFKRAAAFRDRTIAHLRRAGVQDGEAVMLVDVGYKGTVQNVVTPMLEAQMGLHVAGRYLFLREECVSGLDKVGLLDVDMIECRAMHALATCVAVVEQMCNLEQGSTIDFKPDGTPIREDYELNVKQGAMRERIQSACVDFARHAYAEMHRRPASDDVTARRRMAAAILTRLLYLPMPREIELFKAFDHDNNLGSKTVIKLLDPTEAEEGLRRRGLAYVSENRRMYVPAEIAKHGLPLNISLLSCSRFALDFRNSDFQVGGIDVPVLLLDATEQTVMPMTAYPTHEGYYRLSVPIKRGWTTVAVQFGQLLSSVQIGDACWIGAGEYDADWVADRTAAITMTDGMQNLAGDLYACEATGVLIAAPPNVDDQVLSLVFRPLHARASDAAEVSQQIAA